MNFAGILFSLIFTLAVVSGFIWVIKLEYFVGAHIAQIVFIFGVVLIVLSLFVNGFILSTLMGVFSGSILWGAIELVDQEKRVKKELFPSNPNKRKKSISGTGACQKPERGEK